MATPKPTTTPFKNVYLSDIINGAHGDIYQRDLALVMFERATREGYDFQLGYEMALADKFDDVAFFNESKNEWILVQTKHADISKGKSQPLKFEMLFPLDNATRDKGDFSLYKYLKSYITVQANIEGNKNVIIFTNRDFPVNEHKGSVEVITCKVDKIFEFNNAMNVKLQVQDDLMKEMLNYVNKEFDLLRDSIVKLFSDGVMEPAIKNYKTPVAAMLTKANNNVMFSKNPPPEAKQMLQSLTTFIDIGTAQQPLAKCKDIFIGNSRSKTLPIAADEETVCQFFRDLVLCARQPEDLREIIEQDLRSWMRTWIRPNYLMRLEESQLKIAGHLEEYFNGKQSHIEKDKDGNSYKKFLLATEGNEFFDNTKTLLEKQIQNLSNYSANNTDQYYVNRQIQLAEDIPNLNSNRIRDEKFVDELFETLDKQRLLLLAAEPGMGKSTILEFIAFRAQQTSKHCVYLFNLNTFHQKLDEIRDTDTVDILLSVLGPTLSDENIENLKDILIHHKKVKTKHLMIFDAFDEVFPDNRFKVLRLFHELLQATNIKILLSTRRTVKTMVEKDFRVQSMSLVPLNDHDQTNFLRKFWKVQEENEESFIKYKTNMFKGFNSDINQALNEFTGLPLLLKMMGEVYADHFEEYLKSVQNNFGNLLPQEIFSTINLYEQFVRKCFANRMQKKIGNLYLAIDDDNIVLFNHFALEHQLLAIKHLKLDVLQVIIEDKTDAGTLRRFEKRISSSIERSALVEATDNDYRFVHRTYAEFLVATFLIFDIENRKANIFGAYLQASLFIEYPMIRIFFFALIESQFRVDHLEIIGNYYLRNSDIALWACEVHGRKTVENLLLVKCDSTIVNRLLCVASEHNCYNICAYLLKNHQNMVDRNFIDWIPLEGNYMSKCWSPLHIAASKGHTEVIKLILENSGNVNVKNERDWTPLHIAANKRIVSEFILKALQILIENSGDIDAEEEAGWTPLHLAAQFGNIEVAKLLVDHSANVNAQNHKGSTPLHLAALHGNAEFVEFLIKNFADIDVKSNKGRTSLHAAAEYGCTDVVKILTLHGKNNNLTDTKGFTPLHYAIQNGHLEIFNILIENVKDINVKTKDGRTPLHFAAEDGNTNIVRLLIGGDASQINSNDIYGWTSLHYAAASGNVEVVKLLIDQFEDVNAIGCFGKIPLHLASENGNADVVEFLVTHCGNANAKDSDGYTALHLAAESGYTRVAAILATKCEDINSKTYNGRSPIHIAAENGHTNVVKLLIENSADIAAKGDYERTCLHYASKSGHSNIVQTLIEHKADVNAKDRDDWTPLHYAALNGYVNVVKILIGHFANVNSENNKGATPLHCAIENGHQNVVELLIDYSSGNINAKDNDGCMPSHYASKHDRSDILKTLIINHGVDVNAKNIYGWTPLHFAAQNACLSVVKYLIGQHAIPNTKDNIGRIALHYAAKNGHKRMVVLLVKHSPGTIEEKDNDGFTPLHFAAYYGHLKIVRILLTNSTDFTTEDSYGRTPLHCASINGHFQIVKTLIQKHSVNVNATDIHDWTPLHYAAQNGHVKIVRILIDNLANVNTKSNKGAIPLHCAAKNGHLNVIKLLIEASSDNINARDYDGCTPLNLAAKNGHSNVAELLQREAEKRSLIRKSLKGVSSLLTTIRSTVILDTNSKSDRATSSDTYEPIMMFKKLKVNLRWTELLLFGSFIFIFIFIYNLFY